MPNLLLTTICNRRCRHCFAANEIGSDGGETFLSLADLDWILAFLERAGVRRIGVLGGEPTLHPRFEEVLERIRRSALTAQLFTNGLCRVEVLDWLAAMPADRLGITVNTNVSAGAADVERARMAETIGRLGARARLGFTIDHVDADPHFLIDMIEATGAAREVRLGVAHPIVGGSNRFLPLSAGRPVGRLIADFVRRARSCHIAVGLDCGIPRCIFDDGEWAEVDEWCRHASSCCRPVIDVGPGLDVWHCFPLSRVARRNVREFASYGDLVRYFAGEFSFVSRVGALPACAACRFLHDGQCTGGCLAHPLSARAWPPTDWAA